MRAPAVREAIEAVSAAGSDASMSMLGGTVFTLDAGPLDVGYDAAQCSIPLAGAHLR